MAGTPNAPNRLNEMNAPSPDRRAPFLVLAHHRSGSNFLNDLLQAHPGIECLNEPLSMQTGFFRTCDLAHWPAGSFDSQALHPSIADKPDLRDFLFDFRAYLLQSNAQRVIGFKETVLFGKLEWLKAFMPTLKVVFLQRDAREIVSSVLRSSLTALWRYDELVPTTFARYFPGYRSRLGATSGPELRAAETAAKSIAVRYEIARRTLGLFEHTTLHLEALMREPARGLESLSALLGVAPHPRQMDFLRERQRVSRGGAFSSFRTRESVDERWRRDLSADQLQVIHDVLHAADHAGAWRRGEQAA
jgi:hypothetical protein